MLVGQDDEDDGDDGCGGDEEEQHDEEEQEEPERDAAAAAGPAGAAGVGGGVAVAGEGPRVPAAAAPVGEAAGFAGGRGGGAGGREGGEDVAEAVGAGVAELLFAVFGGVVVAAVEPVLHAESAGCAAAVEVGGETGGAFDQVGETGQRASCFFVPDGVDVEAGRASHAGSPFREAFLGRLEGVAVFPYELSALLRVCEDLFREGIVVVIIVVCYSQGRAADAGLLRFLRHAHAFLRLDGTNAGIWTRDLVAVLLTSGRLR